MYITSQYSNYNYKYNNYCKVNNKNNLNKNLYTPHFDGRGSKDLTDFLSRWTLLGKKILTDAKFKVSGSNTPTSILNFHVVDKYLLRGADIKEHNVKELSERGVTHIFDFRSYKLNANVDKKTYKDESRWTKDAGIQYHWLPFEPYDNPPEKYVEKFFEVMDNVREKGEKAFIHCHAGMDRTGTMAAIYKIKYLNASLEDVLGEMREFGHDWFCYKNLDEFVEDFAKRNE